MQEDTSQEDNAPLLEKERRRLRELMYAKGYNQKTLGIAIGKTQTDISRWLRGRSNPSKKELEDLYSCLGETLNGHSLQSMSKRIEPQWRRIYELYSSKLEAVYNTKSLDIKGVILSELEQLVEKYKK